MFLHRICFMNDDGIIEYMYSAIFVGALFFLAVKFIFPTVDSMGTMFAYLFGLCMGLVGYVGLTTILFVLLNPELFSDSKHSGEGELMVGALILAGALNIFAFINFEHFFGMFNFYILAFVLFAISEAFFWFEKRHPKENENTILFTLQRKSANIVKTISLFIFVVAISYFLKGFLESMAKLSEKIYLDFIQALPVIKIIFSIILVFIILILLNSAKFKKEKK